jgi:DNA-directed RNA polymerase subunit K/omega
MEEKNYEEDYETKDEDENLEEELDVTSVLKKEISPKQPKDEEETDDDEDKEDDEDEDDDEYDKDEDDDDYDGTSDRLQQQINEQSKPAFADLDNFTDDDDDEDNDDDNYLQKFDEVTQQKIIEDYHPELKSHNYDEVDILSKVVRDDNGNIIDPLHRTLPFLTRYEKARILGERAKQINSGAKPMIEVDPNIIDGYLIALKEYEQKAIPFILKRPLPNGGCEYWRFEDLEVLE